MFPGFYIGERLIPSYSIMALIGILTAVPFSVYYYRKRCKADADMILIYLAAGVGAFLGMHLLYGITNIPHFGLFGKATSLWELVQVFTTLFGGSVFYGGLLGGLAGGAVYIRKTKMNAALTSDCAAPAVALFHAFGRVGCFLGGCCYGIEADYGITFTDALTPSANGVPRVPVQLYEAAFELALFVALWRLLATEKLKGKLMLLYLTVYPVGRFILEFLRGDMYRGFLFGLSTSQIISIILFIVCGVLFIFRPTLPYEQEEKENTNEFC